MTVRAATSARVTIAGIRAEIDTAHRKGYGTEPDDAPVLGLLAAPDATLREEFTHPVGSTRVSVRVVPCVSALAARAALLTRRPGSWLVIVTDRPPEDLGAGVLAHLIGQRLRASDPWLSIRAAFGANGIDRTLSHLAHDRAIAEGLLAVAPDGEDRWPAAPGGLLSRDHAFSAVARHRLGLRAGNVDGTAVVQWTSDPAGVGRLATLRARGGDTLADAVLDFLAERTGTADPLVRELLREGRTADVVPVGIVAALVRDAVLHGTSPDVTEAARALWGRLVALGPASLNNSAAADTLGRLATLVAQDLLEAPPTWRRGLDLVAAADALLTRIDGSLVAASSDLLAQGLSARYAALGEALRTETPWTADAQVAVSAAFSGVTRHALTRCAPREDLDPRQAPTQAAVRLGFWLATADVRGTTLGELAQRHIDDDSWVDSAVHDAAAGVADTDLAVALNGLLAAVRQRRARHDEEFADELTRTAPLGVGVTEPVPTGHSDTVHVLEGILRDVVVPLVQSTPALLIVLDGMSARVADELTPDIAERRQDWREVLVPGHGRRAAALAVLPTLTEYSRVSLLCGQLRRGTQVDEKSGHLEAVRVLGGGTARLFHKKDLDTSEDGFELAHGVRDAIADLDGVPLVTCVLNTIDDALNRSDPGGMEWTTSTIRHLGSLLDAAAAVGRPVVLTADHGHVVERRKGTQKPYSGITSARSRSADPPAGHGEVLLEGPRVLGGPAVLAVDELLRYGPLNAGYHGGASPGEVVVPVILMWPGAVPDGSPYCEAPPQHPDWWDKPFAPAQPVDPGPGIPGSPDQQTGEPRDRTQQATLFEEPSSASPIVPSVAAGRRPKGSARVSIGRKVTSSRTFRAQTAIAGRISLDPEQCAGAIDALAGAPGARLPRAQAARALAVSEQRLAGAVAQLQKMLNVEGYPVVRLDGGEVLLDLRLLEDQFEVQA